MKNNNFFTNADIYHIYRSGKCLCSAPKWERQPFCPGCYEELSRETKEALRRKFGQGFESAFRHAVREIAGETEAEIYLGQINL